MRGQKITEVGNIVKAYLRDFPDLSSSALAQRILSNPMAKNHFRTEEHARSTIRYYRGTSGAEKRQKLAIMDYIQTELIVPKGQKNEIKHYKLPTTIKKVLLISDVHAPYHDELALKVALQTGIDEQVDCIIINGDFIDFYSKSRFESDYRQRDFPNEVNVAKGLLQMIRRVFPHAHIVYKIGNHDDRWNQFLVRNEIKGLDCLELSALLGFAELGIIEVGNMATIWANKLAIIHGHEHKYGMIAPVNPARGLFLRTKQSALMSHVHRVSEHTEKTHAGKLIGCWSTGCLCQLTPDYMPYNNHYHGFAIIELYQKGMFTVYNKKVIDGNVY
jgi:predicted phosphodiesterase